MCIKKYLFLILVIALGVIIPMGVRAMAPVDVKSSESIGESQKEANTEDMESSKEHSDIQSDVDKSCGSEEVSAFTVKSESTVEKPSECEGDDECSCSDSNEKYTEKPVEVIKLTPNGRKIVRSLQNGFGLNLDILEQPNGCAFSKNICAVYALVREEPALCVAPEGPALVVGNLNGDIFKLRESILAARIAFETGQAESVVFLGNYANIGDFCVETLNELFKFKLEFPNKVFLVCGSSEAGSINSFENSELVLDLGSKFSKENVDIILRQVDALFKRLPVAVEVSLPTKERVLCLYGNIPIILTPSGKLACKELQVWDFLCVLKRLNVQFFMTRESIPVLRSIVGLISYSDRSNLEFFLKLVGYKYLVRCVDRSDEDIVEQFDGRCYALSNSIGVITKAGVRSLGVEPDSEICSVGDWNKCAIRKFVLSADKSDPDVLVSFGLLSEQDGNIEQARKFYEEAVVKGSVVAHYKLGMCYKHGKGGAKDCAEAVRLFQIAASRNYVKAQNELGLCYANAEGIEKNYGLAVKYYWLASSQGYMQAQYNLGGCYDQGRGVKRDMTKAIVYYKRAALRGCVQAQCYLGDLYEMGREVRSDYSEAVEWYRLAANKGYAQAQYKMGSYYEKGYGVPTNVFQAVKWYGLAAEQGHAQAQNKLGDCYRDGCGIPKDEAKAVSWYRKAVDGGCVQAQYELGVCYERGCGVPRDLEQAVKCYLIAADKGCVQAQCELGVCYAAGKGVPQNDEQAVSWYRKAVDSGCVQAKCNLGVCYITGKGIEENYDRAVILFNEAASHGCVQALYSLGVCYENGFGFKPDYDKAVQYYKSAASKGFSVAQWEFGVYCAKVQDYDQATFWFRVAADQDFVNAQYDLGLCYEKGLGVNQDYNEALEWFKKAAAQGDEDAQHKINEILGLLS